MKRLLTLIAVVAFAGLMLTGCGGQQETAPEPAPETTNAPAATTP
jgi:hypothetical protein